MIRRNITRTALNTVETTEETKQLNGGELSFVVTTPDFFYVGFQGPFASRYFQVGTANTNASVVTVEYWDGSAFTEVDDLQDETSVGGVAFARNGFLSWVNKGDWEKSAIAAVDSDIELFWVRLSVSADLSAGTTLDAVVNLFSDDNLFSTYYPEISSDYYPTGKTNFLEQHESAKDYIILRLKQRRVINEESDVVDPNPLSVASIHRVAYLIFHPIAVDEQTIALATRAQEEFEREISQTKLGVDQNNDGVINDGERLDVSQATVVRR